MTSPSCRKFTADRLVVVPWKNGGGVTTEIASGPPCAEGQAWSWRVSVADVGATGPFSEFPGIDRTICVIEGGGMDLQFEDGRSLPLEPNLPVDFDGGATVTGILRDEAIRDFNVMVDRRFFRAGLEIVQEAETVSRRMRAGGVLLVHMLDGASAATANGREEKLGPKETLILDGEVEAAIAVGAGARAAIVTLESQPLRSGFS